MAHLTLPNQWGKEGFNVIRQALIDYCRPLHPDFDLGYAFEWDTAVPLIKNGEGLSDAEYINCSTALAMITNHLHEGKDPWRAVAAAKAEWKAEKETVDRLFPDQPPESSANPEIPD